jgi:glycosyltransferase involved in cell wall biosynthesis
VTAARNARRRNTEVDFWEIQSPLTLCLFAFFAAILRSFPLHLVALVESESHVCCRYRITAFRPHLEAAGHTLTVRELGGSFAQRFRAIGSVRTADVVIVQRKLLSLTELVLLRRSARKLVFDFDDALWLRDSYSGKGFESGRRHRRFGAMVRRCDAVVAGNRFLADEARRFNPNVAVIPTCVEPAAYPMANHDRPPGEVRLVWVGSSSTLQGLERNRDLLNAVGQAVPGARLKVICDRFPTLDHLPVDPVPWNDATEAAEIADADIGIGWVPDDPWSRGKCGLKLLQYQAAGLAVVANPVGVQADIVRAGETGMQATTADEWVAAVRTLANGPELRRRLGRAGREQAEQKYSVEAGSRAWAELLYRMA